MKLIAAISLLLTTRYAAESGFTSELGCDPIGGSNFASRFEACGTYEECEGECGILETFFSSLTTIETDRLFNLLIFRCMYVANLNLAYYKKLFYQLHSPFILLILGTTDTLHTYGLALIGSKCFHMYLYITISSP